MKNYFPTRLAGNKRRSANNFYASRTLISLAVSSMFGLPALAQTANPPADAPAATSDVTELKQVVVTGIRASLMHAQDLKRISGLIVDSIVADDIGKLPDANVAEALQRITGVQVSRDQGEGAQVQVRGLSQVETLLNGREIFTAGKERGLSFQDIPSELLSGADVYKTSSSDLLEGGIGGVIDLRTRHPFDFTADKEAATFKTTYADYAKKQNADGSVLLSNRWKVAGGDFGALVSLAYQNRDYRADLQELGPPSQTADGLGIYAPTGAYSQYELGERTRTGVSTALQYRPSKDLEFYLDGNYTNLKTRNGYYGLYVSPYWANSINFPITVVNPYTGLGQPGIAYFGALYPNGTLTAPNNVLQKGTFWGADMATTGAINDSDTETTQLAIGAKWHGGSWKVRTDLAATRSHYVDIYNAAGLGDYANGASVSYDTTTKVPSAYPTAASGVNLASSSGYYAGNANYFKQVNEARETAWRIDADDAVGGKFWTTLHTGLRLSNRTATSGEISTLENDYQNSGTGSIGGTSSAFASQLGVIPYNNLLSAAGSGTYPTQWLSVTNLGWLRDPQTSRTAMGLSVPTLDPAQTFNYYEDSAALYGRGDFETELLGKAVTGNVGLRYVAVHDQRNYNLALAAGVTSAKEINNTQNELLPSVSLRMDITDKLVGRFSASKTVTLPDFMQMVPSLTLNANDKTGYQGNPNLQAITSRNVDAALEYYLSKSDYLFGTTFYKLVDGFVQTGTTPYSYGGSIYNVQTPVNGPEGTIKGLELGYQGFFTSLPGLLRGLGLQANFTYVDSSAPGVLIGQKTQLENLSRDSYNLVGMYDLGDLSARLAYSYRGKYLAGSQNYYVVTSSTAMPTIGQTPVYMEGYGLLDAYFSYAIGKHVKLAFEGNNLLRSVRQSYYGVTGLPRGTYVDDRRYGLSMHVEM
ncbi:MAG TPA: TonB-dependent receptor [Burkholderiaceae bacterium]